MASHNGLGNPDHNAPILNYHLILLQRFLRGKAQHLPSRSEPAAVTRANKHTPPGLQLASLMRAFERDGPVNPLLHRQIDGKLKVIMLNYDIGLVIQLAFGKD